MKQDKQKEQKECIAALETRIAELERDEAAQELRYDLLLRKYRIALERLKWTAQGYVSAEFFGKSEGFQRSAAATLRELAALE